MAWITDKRIWTGPITSPKPIFFQREFDISKKITKAEVSITSFGIYYAQLNGVKIGNYYLTPGFTSYEKHLQVQKYDVTKLLKKENCFEVTVSGGWAVETYGYCWKSKNYENRQGLWFQIELSYEDGTSELIASDKKCRVGRSGYVAAEIYNGEIFDATKKIASLKQADEYQPKLTPKFIEGGPYVMEHEVFQPISVTKSKKGYVYDFGQNMAGIIRAKLKAKSGQQIEFYHAEILVNGELNRKILRRAKARDIYIAKDGEQTYQPQLTYHGFRYCEVRGIEPEHIELTAIALYSDVKQIGSFKCSNKDINQLQRCIEWGAKSNLVDIPTDCPQRNERLGWTADTAVFAATCCFNFQAESLYRKWLLSMRDDQGDNGQIPDVVPKLDQGNKRSAPIWADACAIVPWSAYMAYGDLTILKEQYDCIKHYIGDGLNHLTDYVWDKGFQYGDWCAPGKTNRDWKKRGPLVGTCYFANTVKTAAAIAEILEFEEDKSYYDNLYASICEGFEKRFVKADGTMKEEYQSAYVLPLHFQMAGKNREVFARRLAELVEEDNYHLSTGFAGTPYLLFALADNGYIEHAYKVLMQDTCPSWLYEVKAGATTMWERWDALRPDGTINDTNNMVSFNHYAYGAVGDFLYRRVAGIEAVEPGYRLSRIAPMIGGGLTQAGASTETPYGIISVYWKIDKERFTIDVIIPNGTKSIIHLPSGEEMEIGGGTYTFSEPYRR